VRLQILCCLYSHGCRCSCSVPVPQSRRAQHRRAWDDEYRSMEHGSWLGGSTRVPYGQAGVWSAGS